MRTVLAVVQLVLAVALGVASVWAFSDPEPEWAQRPLVEPARVDLSHLHFPATLEVLGRPASAFEPTSPADSAPTDDGSVVRVAPPFVGLALTAETYAIARQAEPLRLEAEQDEEGRWVIGYGRRVSEAPTRAISRQLAEEMLVEDLTAAEQAVRRSVQLSLSADEYGALVEFARTVGPETFADTLVAMLLNAGDREAAADAFMIWSRVRVDGALVDSPGRSARLDRLRALFLGAPTEGA